LTPEFLDARGTAFKYYLSPEAYRYYLPALLTGALQEFSENGSLTYSVVWNLRPSFWALYDAGDDRDLRARQSAFTEDQYGAVCAFLGLVFDQLPRLRHLAAQALYWGWNQLDTPDLEAVKAYYHELCTFSYPEPDDPEVAALCREIRAAFAETPYPGDDKLCSSNQDEEAAECAIELRDVKWQSAHPELLARNYTALSFLSNAGFRYFLPAFLLADLVGYGLGYESNADPVFDLTYGLDGKDWREVDRTTRNALDALGIRSEEQVIESLRKAGIGERRAKELLRKGMQQSHKMDRQKYSRRRLSVFTRPERMAIIAYLEYRAATYNFRAAEIHQALENYWRPSVSR
jgi:hypothetical protein